VPEEPEGISPRVLRIRVRNELFHFIRSLASGDVEEAWAWTESGGRDEEAPASAEALGQVLEQYRASGHQRICTDTKARGGSFFLLGAAPVDGRLTGQQILVDPEGHNDWGVGFAVDLARSRAEGKPVITLSRIGPL
jgi:hypothetical protein